MAQPNRIRVTGKPENIEIEGKVTLAKRKLKRAFLIILVVIAAIAGSAELVTAIDQLVALLK